MSPLLHEGPKNGMPSRENTHDSAVSPIVGVMLLLSVVIIIAVVVNACAGGFASSLKKPAKTAVIRAEYSKASGLLVTHTTGDTLNLRDCRVVLTLDGMQFDITDSTWRTTDGSGRSSTILGPRQTLHSNEINNMVWFHPGPTGVSFYDRVVGKNGMLEIYDNQGLRVAKDDFTITK